MRCTILPLTISAGALARAKQRLWSRIGPFASIVLLHAALFYALQNGLLQRAAQTMPKEIFATLIAPEPAAPAAAPQPAAIRKTRAAAIPLAPSAPLETAVAAAPPPAAAALPISEMQTPSTATATTAIATIAPTAPPPTIATEVEYLQPPQPEYPALARRMREQGKVVLRVLVDEKGHPERADVHRSSGSARLDEAARQAVLRALFKPHHDDGRAVAVYALVPIQFQLDG